MKTPKHHSPLRGSSTLHTSLTTLTILLAASGVAPAWPFKDKLTGNTDGSILAQLNPCMTFLQVNADRSLEYSDGSTYIAKRHQGITNGTHIPEMSSTGIPASNYTGVSMAAGDIDGDGDIDIVRSGTLGISFSNTTHYVRLYSALNSGSGTFTKGPEVIHDSLPANRTEVHASKLLLCDFDGDGDPDLANDWDRIKVTWNPGNGDFTGAATPLAAAYDYIEAFHGGDFDGNGRPDFMAVVNGDGTFSRKRPFVMVFYNSGIGFTGQNMAFLSDNDFHHASALADVNGDGISDLILGSELSSQGTQLAWLRGTGNTSGTAAAGFDMSVAFPTGGQFSQMGYGRIAAIQAGDMDEDGQTDLVVAAATLQPTSYADTYYLFWLRNTGGTFAAPVKLADILSNGQTGPKAYGLADQDQDGDLDIIYDGGTRMLENTAIHRRPSARVAQWTGSRPGAAASLAAGDINHDGRLDLVASDAAGKRLLWYAGTASGISAPWIVSTSPAVPSSVDAADINRDGFTDLIWASSNTITRSLNANGAGFVWQDAPVSFMTGVQKVCVADCDRDGDPDVLGMAPAGGGVRWHINVNNAASWTVDFVTTSGAMAGAAGQFDTAGPLEMALHDGAATTLYSRASGAWQPIMAVPSAGGGAAAGFANIYPERMGAESIFAGANGDLQARGTATGALTLASSAGTTRRLLSADWNLDGNPDILRAGSQGVDLIQPMGKDTAAPEAPVTLLSGVDVQDLVLIPLDGDGAVDAVAVSMSGQLYQIFNTSSPVTFTAAALPSVQAVPGTPAPLHTILAETHYLPHPPSGSENDASAYLSGCVLRFYKAAPTGPGAPMTAQEVAATISQVSLNGGNGSAPFTPGGGFFYYLPGGTHAVENLGFGAPRSFTLEVTPAPGAAAGPITKLYVELAGCTARGVDYFNQQNLSPGSLDAAGLGLPARTYVEIVPALTMTPLQQWRKTHFNQTTATGSAANDADPDGDSVPNLVEYATGTSPVVRDATANASAGLALLPPATGQAVKFTLTLSTAAMTDSKLRLTVQQTTDMLSWGTATARTGGGPWTGLTPAVTAPLPTGVTGHSFTNTGVIAGTVSRYFLRLKAEELP